jgi:hypothetical protein
MIRGALAVVVFVFSMASVATLDPCAPVCKEPTPIIADMSVVTNHADPDQPNFLFDL